MAEEQPVAAGPQLLKVIEQHSKQGHVSAVWVTVAGNPAAVTAGADGRLVLQQIKPSQQQLKEVQAAQGPVHVFSANAEGSKAVMGGDKNHIMVVQLPEVQVQGHALTRFTAAPCCCCWSKDGLQVLAGADDGTIKLITVADTKVRCTLRCEPFIRGLALDPDGKYVAAATADGTLLLWQLGGSSGHTQELKKRLAPKLDHEDMAARQGLAWHPEGTVLAVAGPENDVILLERLSWKVDGYLAGGHIGSVGVVAFSPNGIYVATAGADCKVVVWHVGKKEQVSSRQLPSPASSLAWHPQANMILVGSSGGGHGIWPGPVPEKEQGLDSPWVPIDQLLAEADRATAAAAAAAAAAATTSGAAGSALEDDGFLVDDLADEDEDEDEAGGGVIRRRGLKRLHGAATPQEDSAATGAPEHPQQPGGGGDADTDAFMEELDAVLQEAAAAAAAAKDGGGGGYAGAAAAAAPGPGQAGVQVVQYRPKRPQLPIQPGSTPEGSGSGSSAGARFLAYNRLGCVVSKEVDDHHVIEVCFLDTAKHRLRVPNLTDFYGFRAASLGPRGAAYISPAAGEEQASMLVYRSFESWASGTDWTVPLPAGEEALAVAAGSSCVAVATSEQVLRLYSLAGRQLSVLSLPGAPVALVAAGPVGPDAGGLEAAVQHHLAVVWAEGPPEPLHNTQQLTFRVVDVSRCCQCYDGQLVLSPGSSLTWAGFSKEGCLATYDSAGTLRVRTPDWGGAWVPVLDAAGAKAICGAAQLWPVWLDGSSLTAVPVTAKAPFPQALPRPVLTRVALRMPMASADGGAVVEEERLLHAGLLAAQVKSLDAAAADGDADDLAEQLKGAEVECDRKALPLFLEYVKAGKQARALEVVGGLNLVKSIEGALKLANRQHMAALAERIQAFLEQRLDWEAQQAAAAQQQLAGDLEGPPYGWAGGGAVPAAAAGGADTDMDLQQDQASQFVGAEASSGMPAATAAAAAGGAAGRTAPIFGAAARQAGGAGGAGGGGAKRKPTAADLGAGAKAGGGVNPFARKKAVR